MAAAEMTNIASVEPAEAVMSDVLAYMAHFCDRCGLEARAMFERGLRSYEGDSEDGPGAAHSLGSEVALAGQPVRFREP
jgi:hypothetical protein